MFGDSREFKFVSKLIDCIAAMDFDKFEAVEKEYRSLLKGDAWYSFMMLRIKEKVMYSNDGGIC